MKKLIRRCADIKAKTRSELIESFNNSYSKRDVNYRTVDKDGNICFKRPEIVNRLLKSYNKSHEKELNGNPLITELDGYEDENGYNIGYWYVR